MSIILKLEDDLITNLKGDKLKNENKGKNSFDVNISGTLIFLISLSFIELAIIIALLIFIFIS